MLRRGGLLVVSLVVFATAAGTGAAQSETGEAEQLVAQGAGLGDLALEEASDVDKAVAFDMAYRKAIGMPASSDDVRGLRVALAAGGNVVTKYGGIPFTAEEGVEIEEREAARARVDEMAADLSAAFPERYAGVARDRESGRIVVYAVGALEDVKGAALKSGIASDRLSVSGARASLVELRTIKDQITSQFSEMEAMGVPITAVGLDIVGNQVLVTVTDRGREDQHLGVLRDYFGSDLIGVRAGSPMAEAGTSEGLSFPPGCEYLVPVSSSGTPAYGSDGGECLPVHSGMTMRSFWNEDPLSHTALSSGFVVREPSGNFQLLTAGHGGPAGTPVTNGASLLGRISRNFRDETMQEIGGLKHTDGDVAVIDIPDRWAGSWQLVERAAPESFEDTMALMVTGRTNPIINDVVCKNGGSTQRTCGAVIVVEEDYVVGEWLHRNVDEFELFGVWPVLGSPGDSGAGVWMGTGTEGEALAVGVFAISGPTKGLYVPMVNLLRDLGNWGVWAYDPGLTYHDLPGPDVDDDSYGDGAVAAPIYSDTGAGSLADAAALVMHGDAAGLSASNVYVAGFNDEGMGAHSEYDLTPYSPRLAASLAEGDIFGDGIESLVVGHPTDYTGGEASWQHGWVSYQGEPEAGFGHFWLHQDTGLIPVIGHAENYGDSVVVADLNGDGYGEVIVGAPGTTVDGQANAGRVYVHPTYRYLVNQSWVKHVQPSAFYYDEEVGASTAEAGALFGQSLTAGDFNSDGYADVVITAPGANANEGELYVIYGSPTIIPGSPGDISSSPTAESRVLDLGGAPATSILQSDLSPAVYPGGPGEEFGKAVAVGDFDGDGFDDLAVSGYKTDIGAKTNAGVVFAVYGKKPSTNPARLPPGGLDTDRVDTILAASPQKWGKFGHSLAAGDFDGSGSDDLAIGAPFTDTGGIENAGVVTLVHSVPGDPLDPSDHGGFEGQAIVVWHQDTPGIASAAQEKDRFGFSLSSRDFDADGYFDLLVGADGEDRVGVVDTGMVHGFYGTPLGLTVVGDRYFTPGNGAMPGDLITGGKFGRVMAQ